MKLLSVNTKMVLQLVAFACLLASSQAYSIKSSLASSRIIGGEDAKPGEFPHQVDIEFSDSFFHHICGGSIINEQWILTSAGCIKRADSSLYKVTIYVGKHYLNTTEPSVQELAMETYFIHEKFHQTIESSRYDIALIKLSSPLQFNKRVAPISLTKKDSQPAGKVIVSGWGYIGNNHVIPNTLQKAELDIIDLARCNKTIYELTEKFNGSLSYDAVGETNFCTAPLTSTGGLGPCNGDQGNPAMLKHSNGQLQLVGIVSRDVGSCISSNGVATYIKVSSFIDWIHNIISTN